MKNSSELRWHYLRVENFFRRRHTVGMVIHPTPPLSRFLRQRQAEAELAAQRKRERAEATERRIRREAEATAQRAKALALRRAGATYDAIGAALGGLSSTRAQQIVRKAERLANDPRWYDKLPMRAQTFLYGVGLADLAEIDAVTAVAKLSQRELLSHHNNVGKGAVAALAEWLARHGHTFSEDAVMSRKRSNVSPLPTSGHHDQPTDRMT